MPQRATLCLWVLNVRHDHNIVANSRLAGNKLSQFSKSQVLQFLEENYSLYQILIEEDPEYLRMQYLQDAGLVPLGTPSPLQNRDEASILRET